MNKILFIVPPYINFDSFVNPAFNERAIVKKSGSYGSVVTDMPIGLLSLSAYLKKHAEVEIKLIDFNIVLNKMAKFNYSSFSELFHEFLSAKEWIDYSPNIIGVSALFTTSYQNMLDIAQCCRKLFPNAIIIAGGGVPTNMYNEIFRDSLCLDALCYGEGEKPLLGLIKAKDRNEFLRTNQSWITRDKIAANQSFEHDFIENLDEIPFYDYGILNTDDYGLSPTMNTYASFDEKKHLFHIATSRGCPHRCCFCSSYTIHGRKMRYHSVNRVKEDFKRLKEEYGAKTIGFQDDHFMGDRQRAFEIISITHELKMNVFFQSGLALYTLDRKMLEAIKNAGIKQLVLAIESGSNRVLREIMHKPLDLSIVKRVIADCRQLGIDTDINILIGLPGETKQDIEDTRSFLKTIDATWFRIYVATPLVGSEMFDICIKNNYLKGDYIGCDFKKAVIETEDFTAEYIQEKAYYLNLELNFVGNSDFRLGNYEAALKGFENTITIKNDHAFAYYFAAKCCKKLNLKDKYSEYKIKYQKIITDSEFWKDYEKRFNLVALE
ncbi:MAG: radical SAM protein [bacterium]|nr:radical SAM protein [bacterium]